MTALRENDPAHWELAGKVLYYDGVAYLKARFPGSDRLGESERDRVISDAFSDVFVRYLSTVDSEGRLIGLFRLTLFSRAMDHLRLTQRRGAAPAGTEPGAGGQEDGVQEQEEVEDTGAELPDEAFLKKERVFLVDKALSILDQDCRQLIVAHYVEEVSIRAMADRYEMPKSTVESQIRRCEESLRRVLRTLDASYKGSK